MLGEEKDSSILSSFEIIRRLCGDKWKFLIICNLFNGSMRFGELLYYVDSITKKVLSENLRELEQLGLLRRKECPGIVKTVEYTLTETGISLKPIFTSLIEWSLHYSHQYREKNKLGTPEKPAEPSDEAPSDEI